MDHMMASAESADIYFKLTKLQRYLDQKQEARIQKNSARSGAQESGSSANMEALDKLEGKMGVSVD
jgi:hypothetical protein